jgi:hypothetical protein
MGGPIHVVVDDDNIEDYFLDWSLYRDSLHANDDPDGPHYIPYSLEAIWLAQEILCGLRAMSMEDRKESMRNATRYPRGSLPWV